MKQKEKIGLINFSKQKELVEPPHLIAVQKESYKEFLQMDVPPEKRKRKGLESVFQEIFPIEDPQGRYTLEYIDYTLGKPRATPKECKERSMTYGAPLKVRLRLIEWSGDGDERKLKQASEGVVYLGDIPLMTEIGTFIINGAERVVVNQLHRSPGVVFSETDHPSGKKLFSARIVPIRGSWLEFKLDITNTLYIYIDARRKFPVTTLIRAFGLSSDEEIIETFYPIKEINVERDASRLEGGHIVEPIINPETGAILIDTDSAISKEAIKTLKKLGIKKVKAVLKEDITDGGIIFHSLRQDPTRSKEEALEELKGAFPVDIVARKEAFVDVIKLFFQDDKRYDIGMVGRHRMNTRLGINVPDDYTLLTLEDIVGTTKYILGLMEGKGFVDDVDHLSVRRVRCVGELVENQLRIGLTRAARMIREQMKIKTETPPTPADLIKTRAITAVLNSFFGASQLSQFADQVNPLSLLTHERRLSALGPGGLTREGAGFEVRDVHYTHYGRMCPIETPEGQNIGLITSLTVHARLNELGFIETPYRKVKDGKVTDEVVYLSAEDEDKYTIAPADVPVDSDGKILGDRVLARRRDDILLVQPNEVDFVDLSPQQLTSVSAALIPFLEHDDANRALMGSNMQRQAVPLLFTEPPLVATGLEKRVAKDSGAVVVAERDGIVKAVDGAHIEIVPDVQDELAILPQTDIYVLRKFERSNQDTTINQRPLVKVGDRVKAGDIIADGQATSNGELALGRNVLVAFLPWYGYNFEDAIVISERLVRDDVFTSVHIKEFELEVRDTKLGPEELTRDIPHLGEELLKNLNENGIVYTGAEVESGDILVGKVTPRGESELTPEERLLRAIFGEKAEEVKDASLRVPPGIQGIVIGSVVLSRREQTEEAQKKESERLKALQKELKNFKKEVIRSRNEKLIDLLSGCRVRKMVYADDDKEVIEGGEVLTKDILEKLDFDAISPDTVWVDESEVDRKVKLILERAKLLIEEKEEEINEKTKHAGDILPVGVRQLVKVYVAMKRKITVGDKLSGRHGNKGVIAKIVPIEDMPFLPDGTPVDIVLNPLGVPSRMNIGQILETHIGWAAKKLGLRIISPVFNGATVEDVKRMLIEAGLPHDGKTILYNGKTGEPFENPAVVGYMYIMKLVHMADDKIHARSTGPYSLITQQPLGGKSRFGGQRFGEMEVWALEAYGAAHTLQEMLTVKSDDIEGRTKIFESIIKGENPPRPGIPASFEVLVKELKGLCLDVQLLVEEE